MRIFFLTLIFCFSLFATTLQAKANDGVSFQISCGAAGVTSPVIDNIRGLIQSKSYLLLRRRISSGDLATQILCAVALKQLQQQGLVSLTSEEQDQIKAIASHNETYSVCFTCTEHFEGTVRQFFTAKGAPAYSLIKYALFDTK